MRSRPPPAGTRSSCGVSCCATSRAIAGRWSSRPRRRAGAPHGRSRGIALAEWGPTVCVEVAEVSLDADGSVHVPRVVCAVDCGQAVNTGQVEAQMQGGIVFGLSAALYGEITLDKGRVVQGNFDTYPVVRM